MCGCILTLCFCWVFFNGKSLSMFKISKICFQLLSHWFFMHLQSAHRTGKARQLFALFNSCMNHHLQFADCKCFVGFSSTFNPHKNLWSQHRVAKKDIVFSKLNCVHVENQRMSQTRTKMSIANTCPWLLGLVFTPLCIVHSHTNRIDIGAIATPAKTWHQKA